MCSVASRAEKAEAELRECKRANADLTAKLAAAHEALRERAFAVHIGKFHSWNRIEDCTEKECKRVMRILSDSARAVAAFRARVLREAADSMRVDGSALIINKAQAAEWLRAEADALKAKHDPNRK
jgi:hypothetical protein